MTKAVQYLCHECQAEIKELQKGIYVIMRNTIN